MDKKVILEAYDLDNKTFISFTAEWCGPCKRIKPHVTEKTKPYKLILKDEIDITEFKNNYNNFIPFFIIADNFKDFKNYNVLKKIQTSNIYEFDIFLTDSLKNEVIMDDNF